jgi:spore coat protein U-like protein
MLSKSQRTWIFVAVAMAFAGSPVFAGNCFWTAAPTAVAFGTYSVFATADYAVTLSFTFRCTPNQYMNIKLTRGAANQYVPTRWMTSGGNTANYNLFLDAGGTQVWGDSNAGSYTYENYNSTPGNKDFTDYIYGIMPFGQDLAVGSYTDTILATLSYSNAPGGPFTALPAVSIAVTANVVRECRVDTFNLVFGNYNPLAAIATTATSAVKVYCTKGTAPLSVALDNGANVLGTQPRMVSGAGSYLNYNPSLGSTTGSSTSSLVPISSGFALNGTIPALQDVSVGSYIDTLQALVNY